MVRCIFVPLYLPTTLRLNIEKLQRRKRKIRKIINTYITALIMN